MNYFIFSYSAVSNATTHQPLSQRKKSQSRSPWLVTSATPSMRFCILTTHLHASGRSILDTDPKMVIHPSRFGVRTSLILVTRPVVASVPRLHLWKCSTLHTPSATLHTLMLLRSQFHSRFLWTVSRTLVILSSSTSTIGLQLRNLFPITVLKWAALM